MDSAETFRQETREWLDANCPASMCTPAPEAEQVWGGRRVRFKNPDAKIWLERSVELYPNKNNFLAWYYLQRVKEDLGEQ